MSKVYTVLSHALFRLGWTDPPKAALNTFWPPGADLKQSNVLHMKPS